MEPGVCLTSTSRLSFHLLSSFSYQNGVFEGFLSEFCAFESQFSPDRLQQNFDCWVEACSNGAVVSRSWELGSSKVQKKIMSSGYRLLLGYTASGRTEKIYTAFSTVGDQAKEGTI